MKFGIMAPGAIAAKMGQTVAQMPEIENWAVGSRSLERAARFAKDWSFSRAYGSYEELLADQDLELVYIASPHPLHYAQIKQVVLAGKHVLVEKPFVVTLAEAAELLSLARQSGVLLAEAIWTRYMPSRQIINSIIESGMIGTPHAVLASLCYPLQHVPRLSNPQLAASSLYEAGVYPINFACMFLTSKVTGLHAWGRLKDGGNDISSTVALEFADGTEASLYSSLCAQSARTGTILCENGYLEVENINNPQRIAVFDRECRLQRSWEVPAQITGFEYQVRACIEAINAGRVEVPQMPHSEILRIMDILDRASQQLQLRFPAG